ncbi:MAG: hypothetical protein K2N13_01910 [Paraprevotella sp.]|nr:hypothetical protein [Paraprevotella sp.]
MKNIVLTLFCILLPTYMMGQYTKRPDWVNGFFAEKMNSYVEVVSAIGYSEDDARNKAIQNITKRRSLATGQRNEIHINNTNILIKGDDNLTVKARIIDEYKERLDAGIYRVFLLVQTAKNPDYTLESVTVSEQYKFSPLVFVPGMAQIHKGQNTKGILFIAGEVATISGIITSSGIRSSHESKIKRTHDAKSIQSYINRSDRCTNIRNGFIAGAVALYAWNIIDGIVSKGKKHVVIGDTQAIFIPYIDSHSSGLALSFNY